jgi:hypothetical protein
MLYRESGEFPFDNTREPYEGADIEKADWAKRFFCLYDIKAGNLKCIPLFFQIIVRKRLPHSGKDRVHKFSVVFTSHLLRDEKTSGFQYPPDLRRIEIAMAIARKTPLTLFDEPEAGIDLWSFQNLIHVFENIHEHAGGSIIIISHQERILNIADRIIVIANGEIKDSGTKDEVLPKLLAGAAPSPVSIQENALGCPTLLDKMS